MNSLGTRLLAAFCLIILLVILIIGFALVVLLRNHPLVERQALLRLNDVARAVERGDLPTAALTADEAALYAQENAEAYQARVLIMDRDGDIVADSDARSGVALNLRARSLRQDVSVPGWRIGRAVDDERYPWLFVIRPLDAGRTQMLIFALQQPRFPALTFFMDNLALPLVEAAAIAALVAAVLAAIVSRWIALPLQRMAAVAQGIARGDYSYDAPGGGPDEVRALGQSLNAMSRQVQATQQAQRDFLANVSHELKTPLTSIQGFAQAVLDGAAASPEAIKRSAGIIHDEADRMRRLVEGLLDLARLDAGLRALNRAPLDLGLVLKTAMEQFHLRARAKNVSLVGEIAPALPAMVGDADRLAQVISNLLDNALKHTPAGGTVTVAASPAPSGVEITVRDTGSGIPPEDLHRVFERFYQVDKSRAKSGGVGLGLAISREIVAAHGGHIHVESVAGLGSKFTVQLPVAQADDTTVARKRKK
jgi:signal transduction histidine kinase